MTDEPKQFLKKKSLKSKKSQAKIKIIDKIETPTVTFSNYLNSFEPAQETKHHSSFYVKNKKNPLVKP